MSDNVILALIGLIGLIVTGMSQRNANKIKTNTQQLEQADVKLDEIHVLVNRQLSEAMEKIEALRNALTAEVARTESRTSTEDTTPQ